MVIWEDRDVRSRRVCLCVCVCVCVCVCRGEVKRGFII